MVEVEISRSDAEKVLKDNPANAGRVIEVSDLGYRTPLRSTAQMADRMIVHRRYRYLIAVSRQQEPSYSQTKPKPLRFGEGAVFISMEANVGKLCLPAVLTILFFVL